MMPQELANTSRGAEEVDPIDEVNTAQKLCEQQRNQGVVFVGNKPVVCSQGFSADWARAQSVAVAWGFYKATRGEIGRLTQVLLPQP
jgi:hypothetical protein